MNPEKHLTIYNEEVCHVSIKMPKDFSYLQGGYTKKQSFNSLTYSTLLGGAKISILSSYYADDVNSEALHKC